MNISYMDIFFSGIVMEIVHSMDTNHEYVSDCIHGIFQFSRQK